MKKLTLANLQAVFSEPRYDGPSRVDARPSSPPKSPPLRRCYTTNEQGIPVKGTYGRFVANPPDCTGVRHPRSRKANKLYYSITDK